LTVRKREFLKLLDEALRRVNADISVNSKDGGMFGRGLANEGFAGGYAEALRDVDAVLRHGHPSDRRGYWRRDSHKAKEA
jgi:hypothetical protein